MNNARIEELTEVLKKLNNIEVTENLRKDAMEIVANIDPLELSIAEQNLIDQGTKPEELRHLCEIHMDVLKGELDKIKTQIEPGHVIYTFIGEHEKILGFLTELDEINSRLQKCKDYDEGKAEIEKLKAVAVNVLGAEKHHKREEDVLFPEMERRGITGSTRMMRMEHDDLRAKKRQLKEVSEKISDSNFNSLLEAIDEVSKYIVFNLRDHIFKENYILYPTALETVEDKKLWEDMKKRCDEIGYCTFTLEN